MANASEPIGQQSASPTKLRNLYVDTAYVTNHNQWAVMPSTAPTFARFRAASTASCRALSCRDGEQAVGRPQVAAAPLDAVARRHHQPRHTRGAWGREGGRARRRRGSGLASRGRFRRPYCSSPSRSRIKSSSASSPPTGISSASASPVFSSPPRSTIRHTAPVVRSRSTPRPGTSSPSALRRPACRRAVAGVGGARTEAVRHGDEAVRRMRSAMTDLAAAHWAGLLGGPQEATRVPTVGGVGVGGLAARARRTGCGVLA